MTLASVMWVPTQNAYIKQGVFISYNARSQTLIQFIVQNALLNISNSEGYVIDLKTNPSVLPICL